MNATKRVHPASSHPYGDWNYRLFKHDDGEIEIVEVIYDEDGISWCEMFPLRAESDGGLREIVNNWVMAAFDKPVLDRTSFGTEHCCEEHMEETMETDGQSS